MPNGHLLDAILDVLVPLVCAIVYVLLTARFAAAMFVVVDGGCTRVEAVFTLGRNGFKIDWAGMICFKIGCGGCEFIRTALVGGMRFDVDGRSIAGGPSNEPFVLAMVARSRPPPLHEVINRRSQLLGLIIIIKILFLPSIAMINLIRILGNLPGTSILSGSSSSSKSDPDDRSSSEISVFISFAYLEEKRKMRHKSEKYPVVNT